MVFSRAAAFATRPAWNRLFRTAAPRRHRSSLAGYGLGGHHWKKFNPDSYRELIGTALSPEKGVSYLEVAGQEGGDIAMVGAVQAALEKTPSLSESPLTITTRIGYKLLEEGDPAQKVAPSPGDVVVSEAGSGGEPSLGNIVHNLSGDSVREAVESSPLWELRGDLPHLKLVFLLHNPEVQVLELLGEDPNSTPEDRQAYIEERWQPAMATLQELSAGNGDAMSFGVVSNGLGIPETANNPMHLSAGAVVRAAKSHDRFSTVQLPANLLETHGWETARGLRTELPERVSLVAMRPLTCYPDLGTGTGHPFRLVDYALPSLDGVHPHAPMQDTTGNPMAPTIRNTKHTHQMDGLPAIYQIALQTAMSHFDAEDLLEIKQERDLTMEERETLDGCKLVQSMIHDLDADLETVRSFAAHEEELFGRIIPLLYDTFEAMDDRTSDVLQAYFAAYAVAVRYSIARTTRRILKEGDEAGGSGAAASGATYPDLPPSMSLQEYALRRMMADGTFDRLVVGASTMQDFTHQTELVEEIAAAGDSPLDAIDAANNAAEPKES